MDQLVVEEASAAPAPALRQLLSGGYYGSRQAGFLPGLHRGLPSGGVEVNIGLDSSIRLAALPDRTQPAGSFRVAVAGLMNGPALIAHDGRSFGVNFTLSPAGVRSLLGMPAAVLATTVVELGDLFGRWADELVERMLAAPDWDGRFAELDQLLLRQVRQAPAVDAAVAYAWHRIGASGGTVRIGELAAETGYSRQHLARRFTGEFGLTPKQVARIVRFQRSVRLLRAQERIRRRHPELGREPLADVAARCGFHDQAHLAREWNDLAGCPPSVWLATEDLPFVQATAADPVAASSA